MKTRREMIPQTDIERFPAIESVWLQLKFMPSSMGYRGTKCGRADIREERRPAKSVRYFEMLRRVRRLPG